MTSDLTSKAQSEARKKRLAQSLRDNLKRRKQQSRERRSDITRPENQMADTPRLPSETQ